MRNAILPSIFDELNITSQVYKKTATEYATACPKCGGDDRFLLFDEEKPRAWCRHCEYLWFPNDEDWKPDPQELAERAERIRVQKEQLQKEVDAAQALLNKTEKWLEYHASLTEQPRALWKERGINDWWQDWFKLGYSQETYWNSPSITIPIWQHGWEVSNIKHRLLNPNVPGKYRSETKGLPAMPFICNPDMKSGPLFIAEGEIKAIRTYIEMDSNNIQVAGIPTKSPNEDMLTVFADYEPIWLCLDPDVSDKEITRTANKLGKERVRIVQIPGGKIDDLINAGMLNKAGLRRYLRYAKRLI